MKRVKLIDNVTLEGSEVNDGILELSDRSADALVDEGKAVYAEENAQEGTGTPKADEGGQTPDADKDNALALLKRAIDEKYKRDELADAAKDLGVEFAYDAKKAEIVDAVIAAGKADAILA